MRSSEAFTGRRSAIFSVGESRKFVIRGSVVKSKGCFGIGKESDSI